MRIPVDSSRGVRQVNDTKIGQRPAGVPAEEGRKQQYPEYDLQDGDRVKIGETVFQVQMQVAIKLMLPNTPASTVKINMFLREIVCLRALNHPNIVKFIDVGYSSAYFDSAQYKSLTAGSEDVFFLVMEYCNGGTLEDLLSSYRRPLTVEEALPLIYQILDGLAYSHRIPLKIEKPDGEIDTMYGIVHRDLKPSNFFIQNIDGKSIVKIGDYGLAKCFDLAGLSGQTVTGSRAGTPVFMCRQQLLNFKYAKPEVDIWAVAASLYYLLTGQLPRDFDGADPLKAILSNPVIPIEQRGVKIPRNLAQVIDRALDEGNGNQPLAFGSAIEFQRALQSAIGSA